MAGSYGDLGEDSPEDKKFPGFPIWLRRYLLMVILPCAAITGACWLIAAPRYAAEFGCSVTDAAREGAADAASTAEVTAYMKSSAAVAALDSRLNLANLFKGHGIDPITNFWWDDGTPVSLTQYWNRFALAIKSAPGGGAARVRVTAFSPADALNIATALADLGNSLISAQSVAAQQAREQQAAGATAQQDAAVAAARAALNKFRAGNASIDPSQAILAREAERARVAAGLTSLKAERGAVAAKLSGQAPAVLLLDQKIAARQAELAALADPAASADWAAYETLVQNLADARALRVALHRDDVAAVSATPLALTLFAAPEAGKAPVYPMPLPIALASFVLLNLLFGLTLRRASSAGG